MDILEEIRSIISRKGIQKQNNEQRNDAFFRNKENSVGPYLFGTEAQFLLKRLKKIKQLIFIDKPHLYSSGLEACNID